ncbi:hypothetical protein niasHT_034961 [Heterodera trifolii]|uniref:Inositol-pentakisphosphate 2-kinase n=1 Tax=Heterodera trifolii TaxID=157864 RepID=A0ABD2I646_9BILA
MKHKESAERLDNFELVNPNEFRSFCFRGEGCCNLVISAKGRQDGTRIVWRLAKKRNTAIISPKPKCRLLNIFLEMFISPFLCNSYLIKARLVYISVSDLHHLAKIPALPHNMKLEEFSDLFDTSKYPAQSSRFQLANKRSNNNNIENGRTASAPCWSTTAVVPALEMPDATRIPRPVPFACGPTITVELKPKQGFRQAHPGIDLPFCNNCILQIEKCHHSSAFHAMYDFCPLALYSGVRARMQRALRSLLHQPHHNLRLFVDGNVVHEDGCAFEPHALGAALFPAGASDGGGGHGPSDGANIDTFVSAICCILAGVADDRREKFRLTEGSVLNNLLTAQRIDTVGMVRAFELYKSLPDDVQNQLRRKANLLTRSYKSFPSLPINFLEFLEKEDPRSLVERYLLAATIKDCSLMVSIRLVHEHAITNEMISAVGDRGYIRVHGLDGRSFHFAYSIRIVDLDPKSAKNLENSYNRLMAGIRLLNANPHIHPPCVA